MRINEEDITKHKVQVKYSLTCYRTKEMKKFIENIIINELSNMNKKI